MSRELIDRSPDLARLEHEGYEIRTTDDGYLVVDDVPYLTFGPHGSSVSRGSLVLVLELEAGRTAKPSDHVAYWTGDLPYQANGTSLEARIGGDSSSHIASVGEARLLSARADYRDYHHKVTTYVRLLEAEAQTIQHDVTARTGRRDGT